MDNHNILSRLLITKTVDTKTPLCVLKEIASAHSIHVDKKHESLSDLSARLVSCIYEQKVPILTNISSQEQLSNVARFVNGDVEWSRGSLKKAYEYLMGFSSDINPLRQISADFTVGQQSPHDIYSLNACVLYKICTYHNIILKPESTLIQMSFAVRLLFENPFVLLKRVISSLEQNKSASNLVNMLMLSDSGKSVNSNTTNDTVIDIINFNDIPQKNSNMCDSLSKKHSKYSNLDNLRRLLEPKSELMAISLSAMVYSIDISKSAKPIEEYKSLKISDNGYVPIDHWMRYWKSVNPDMFDLTKTFNPFFPNEYYNESDLISMVKYEGYDTNGMNDYYEEMQVIYLSKTFYYGLMPNIGVMETPIELHHPDEVRTYELLCYGSSESSFLPITMQELINVFKHTKTFVNPFEKNAFFSKESINKLKNILDTKYVPIALKEDLLNVIDDVEISLHNKDAETVKFVEMYNTQSDELKMKIANTLQCLLKLGMYMRGWNGIDPYPVEVAHVPISFMPNVDENVNLYVSKFNKKCIALGDIGTMIKELPLVQFIDNIYNPSTHDRYGITIEDRLRIVMYGNETNNTESCIRLSSNWICASAHKYLRCIGKRVSFEIKKLRHIS